MDGPSAAESDSGEAHPSSAAAVQSISRSRDGRMYLVGPRPWLARSPRAVGNYQVTNGSDLGGEAQLAGATSPPGGGPPPAAAVCHVADGGRPPATRPCSVSSICLGLPSVGANPSPRRRASGSIGRWVARVTWWPARCSPPPGPGRLHVPAGADGQGREPHDRALAGTMPLAAWASNSIMGCLPQLMGVPSACVPGWGSPGCRTGGPCPPHWRRRRCPPVGRARPRSGRRRR
jgi:hypothetical protein